MKHLWRQTQSFPSAVRLLMANQFAINLAFYMLMPYLAAHLSGGLGLAAWAVGLVLGVRNFSQQGMFLIGGTFADRYGYKAPILAGCLLRTVGFGLLGWVDNLPALIAASAATGFAGALFNPAVRAYLAAEAGERRVDAFATFNVYYQAGMLLGPIAGLALLATDFRLVCTTAAAIFTALSVLQWRALPPRHASPTTSDQNGVLEQWRTVVTNRPFLLFATAMIGSYVLTFQVYLALPLAAADALGTHGTQVTSGLFVVSAAVAVIGQLRLTGWAKNRWQPSEALVRGLSAMGLAFLPLALAPGDSSTAVLASLVLAVVLLAVGSAVVYPFEMDTIVNLSGERLVATHYGLYNTVSGLGITIGNLVTGALWDFAQRHDALWLTWVTLTATGLVCAAAVAALARTGRLIARQPAVVA
ncbi:MFS transporter [Streptomyces coelicoflavus]|uniref:MFS transporter n=1 Tax=Streptomyces salyersiae TaxID=3075530 RepID=A0ABU2REK6_9ACTN|nr:MULTISPECIES: MFS transporter [unclassified Streptomyces]MYS46635.1 MFS transporter [Streptomyces sp. SID5998]WDI21502.1 MFS transporter [Streptomyces enissocaesilis]AIV33345.1 MFS transporter [Streptomyces sp. CCM_MD2014]MCT7350627.1 MFS transporter [Streptomyces sp. 15-116A]MCW1097625.1 MFS transporter [Streptomyces sp. RS2]